MRPRIRSLASGSAGARVLAVPALLVAVLLLLLTGCGDESESPGETASSQAAVPAAATPESPQKNEGGDGAKKDGDKKPGGDRGHKRGAGDDRPAKRPAKGSGGAGDADGRKTPEGCPAGLTAEQCNAVADAINAGGGNTPDDACPAGISKADCKSVGAALESGSKEEAAKGEQGCPAGISRSQCEQLADALGG